MKIYAGFGDAGFVATNSKKQYETLKSLRYAGTVNRELCVQPDLNHKIDTFDANILNFNLRYLRTNIKFRINKAKLYSMKLSKVEKILTPKVPGNFQHVYYSYQILAKNRDSLKKYLLKNGVETKIQHKYIISDHPGLKNKFNKNTRFLNGNKVKGSTLSLPIHSKIKSSDILKICNLIKKFYQNK
jgi:dTDP-4-amino-4,6-dideoxygalactose transaminase